MRLGNRTHWSTLLVSSGLVSSLAILSPSSASYSGQHEAARPLPAASSGPVAENSAEPYVLSGAMFTLSGEPAANAKVSLSALPAGVPASGMIFPQEFATTRTDATGLYTLRGELDDLAPFRAGDGNVTLELSSLVDGSIVYSTVTATPPGPDRDGWTDAYSASARSSSPLDPLFVQAAKGPLDLNDVPDSYRGGSSLEPSGITVESAPAGSATPSVGGDLSTPTQTAVPEGYTLAPSGARGDMPNCETGEHPFWLITEKTERTRPMIQRLTTLRNSKQSYTWKTTRETALEVAYFGANDYAGGRMGSRKSSTVGHKWTVRPKRSRNLRVEWEYMQFKGGCARDNGTIYYTGAYKGEPWQQTGGSFYQKYSATWNCNRKDFSVRMASKTWYVRTSSVFYDGWFKLGGVSLGASQNNTESHKAVVARVKGRPSPRICGDNDYPIFADRMKEIRRRR